jgi:hypothetical protein
MPSRRLPRLPALCAAACLLALALVTLPAAAAGTTRSCTITQFYVYPGAGGNMSKQAGLVYPDVDALDALVRVDLAGVPDNTKVSVFLVIFSPEDGNSVVRKLKSQHFLPSGTHDIVFPGFLRTGEVFGEHGYDAKVEVSLDGVKPVQQTTSFVITGPAPPDVDIVDLLLYNPTGGRSDDHFEPGDEFTLEATLDIEDNASGVKPKLVVLAVMEEDMYETDPNEAQSQDAHWDSRVVDASNGVYQLSVSGYLPLFFADPWQFRHDFRVYVIVDFGPGYEKRDYALGELQDYHSGDNRRTDRLADRLIELNRSYQWNWDRLRGGKPDTRRFWD